MKRAFDIIVSFISLFLLSPVFIIISILILIYDFGSIFYIQSRVGLKNRDFKMYKFRTMYSNSDKKGLLTVGSNDSRITKIGRVLRKYKLDELPQLINVFLGHMSFVGPRPEVRRYVDMYSVEQLKVLNVRPGITDYASIKYRNENEILANAKDAEKEYIDVIMPHKLKINLEYVQKHNIIMDMKIIIKTIFKIF